MQRPMGVTIIAILGVAFGALAILEGLWIAMAHRPLGMMTGMGGAFAGIVLLGIAALVIVTSVGLLKLQEWSRVLAILLNAVHLVIAALGLLEAFRHVHALFFFGMMLRHIIMIIVGVWIIVYLIQPHVRQAFLAPTAAL
ncbi:MAG: hypothetical protein ACRD4X_03250 [Candidatus Acidiferrales bacterium]